MITVPSGILAMESKSLPDQIHVDADGNWYRVKAAAKSGEGHREGMFSPIEQNKRHMAVIQDILNASDCSPMLKVASVIVFPNPKVVLTGTKPQGVSLVRIDNLQSFVYRARTASPGTTNTAPQQWIDALLVHHRPISLYRCLWEVSYFPARNLAYESACRCRRGLRGVQVRFLWDTHDHTEDKKRHCVGVRKLSAVHEHGTRVHRGPNRQRACPEIQQVAFGLKS